MAISPVANHHYRLSRPVLCLKLVTLEQRGRSHKSVVCGLQEFLVSSTCRFLHENLHASYRGNAAGSCNIEPLHLSTGTESETKAFMAVCIETAKRYSLDDYRTPVFIFERLCSIIYPVGELSSFG